MLDNSKTKFNHAIQSKSTLLQLFTLKREIEKEIDEKKEIERDKGKGGKNDTEKREGEKKIE